MSPFVLNSGQHPIVPTSLFNIRPQQINVQATEDFILEMTNLLKIDSDNLVEAKSRQAQYANQDRRQEKFDIGDKVMISTANIQLASQSQRPTRELQHKFIGPYEIIEKISAVAYKVKLPDSLRIHPVFHISLLKRFNEGPQEYASRINPPPQPVETEESIEYEVEYILDKRTRKFGRQE
ncbi:uncharacterized protein VTP21DRAFT_2219 [Calcarisporiella thermophila]|uniref:uncharacterized protein n=1 Tax=Calcarisporiella thermophila TaxID=911321 RepID=UPI00374395D3